MALRDTQKGLLIMIQSNLKHGDINEIADKSGFSREYVGRVLNATTEDFNEDIVRIATDIIAARKRDETFLLQKISNDNTNTYFLNKQKI